jgi:hypothetical protein
LDRRFCFFSWACLTFCAFNPLLHATTLKYQSPIILSTGTITPNQFAIGDFNGDGKPDLAIPDQDGKTVSIYLNQGDGAFSAPIVTTLAIDNTLGGIICGDVNEDGKADLVVGTVAGDQVAIVLLGNGDGTFVPQPPIPGSFGILSGQLADFNGDGHLDLFIGENGMAYFFLGKGDGAFSAPIYPGGSDGVYFGITAGDFNGDHKLDAVGANLTGSMDFFPGNGQGSFGTSIRTVSPIISNPQSVDSADFNHDGKLDLLIGSSSIASVMFGNGDGTFQSDSDQLIVLYGEQAGSTIIDSVNAVVADLNQDGSPDAVIIDGTSGLLTLVLNDGTGMFAGTISAPYSFQLPPNSYYVATADFNGDGLPDIVVSNEASKTMSILLSSADAIASITPSYGAPASLIQIAGTGFGATQGNSYVTVGGAPAYVASWSNTAISILVPSRATTGNIVVTVGGASSNGEPFTFYPYPSITGISPLSGPVGAAVTITGTGLLDGGGKATVAFNGAPANILSDTSSSITVDVPAGATTGPVDIRVNGILLPPISFTVISSLHSITGISPNYGAPASLVTITGTNFGATQGAGSVTVGGALSYIASWSNTAISILVPSRAITGNIVVTVAGVSSNGEPFTVYPYPAINSISPANGQVGTPVTVTGTGLLDGEGNGVVAFNGTPATILSQSSTSVLVDVPPGATTGAVSVRANGNTVKSSTNFTVVDPLVNISGISPNYGAPASMVSITGTNFGATQGAGSVTVNGALAYVVSWSNTAVVIQVPSRATTGNIVVTAGGVASNGALFTFYPYPAITGVSPASGAAGTSVTITGSNLLDGGSSATVSFNGTPAAISSDTNGSIQVIVPVGATTGRLLVKVNGVTLIADADFTITTAAASSVVVNLASSGSTVTDKLLGMNMAVWYDPVANQTAIVDAFRAAGITQVRWPGGSDSDLYHWSTNTLCNGGYSDKNATFSNFISDMALPAKLDVALTANYGSNLTCDGGGEPGEAAAWVTAALAGGITVSHMTVGNESYGSWEYDLHSTPNDPATYASAVVGTAGYYKSIKTASPNTLVGVVVDADNATGGWDNTVLANARGFYDFVEYHLYPEKPGDENDTFLVQQAAQELTAKINILKSELTKWGTPDTPIYVGEVGGAYTDPGKQSWSITQGLYAGQVLGEMMNAGLSRLTWWMGFEDCYGTSGNNSTSLYGWQDFGAYNVFSDGSEDAACPGAGFIGTMSPTARAFQLFSQMTVNGQTVLTATVAGDTTDVRAYAATNPNGTALLLFNDNEATSQPVTVALSGKSSSPGVTVTTYDKAIYDLSGSPNGTPPDPAGTSTWAAPITTSTGAQTLPMTMTLAPWSMNMVIIQ